MAGPLPEEFLQRFNVSRESSVRLERYVALLLQWQRRINLIGPAAASQVWQRHILDALQLIPLIPPRTRIIADLGSGAGIPGLVLAVATGLEAHLYESNGKKAAFLGEAARQCEARAIIHQVRIETIGSDPGRPHVEVVTARALAPLGRLLDLAAPFLAAGGTGLFHKGRGLDAELTEAAKSWRIIVEKHPSVTDSQGVILAVKEASRVPS
ncbi:MAG: 16S rRNA (guanine(527)-N(7))-methyltransferase RsmG [Hyphomicrobiales bacterium]